MTSKLSICGRSSIPNALAAAFKIPISSSRSIATTPRRRNDSPQSSKSAKLPSTLDSEEAINAFLSQPSWSVSTLLTSPNSDANSIPEITPKTLRHLLSLSALPAPTSPEQEASMLKTLQSQLHFVRALQSVDTTGVLPLSAIREETPEALAELTIGLDTPAIKAALENEDVKGRMKRPRRRRAEIGGQGNALEGRPGVVSSDGGIEWRPVGLKSEEGANMRYFTVKTKGKNGSAE